MGAISSGVLAGLAKIGLVVVSVGGLSAGAYFAYQTGPGGSDAAGLPAGATIVASTTAPLATVTPTAAPTTPEPTPSPTEVTPATATLPPAPTATAEESKWPALPPPPTKPESPSVARETVPGGQWYRLQYPLRGEMICVDFYLPAGHSFTITAPINDPGGFVSLSFRVDGTDSVVSFDLETMVELGRFIGTPDLAPVIDQIASTAAYC